MHDYTHLPKDCYYSVEHVDYDIEMLGLTIDKMAYCGLVFLVGMRLLGPIAAMIVTVLYVVLMRKLYKMELEGRPITFNPKIQRYLRKFPKIFSELTYIELAKEKYRS